MIVIALTLLSVLDSYSYGADFNIYFDKRMDLLFLYFAIGINTNLLVEPGITRKTFIRNFQCSAFFFGKSNAKSGGIASAAAV